MDINRVLFGVITPEGKDTFTATLNGEAPKAKRKVTFSEVASDSSDIEDEAIPTDYSAPRPKKADTLTRMEKLANAQSINDAETCYELLDATQIHDIIAVAAVFPRECAHCGIMFNYHDADVECLCWDCLKTFTAND